MKRKDTNDNVNNDSSWVEARMAALEASDTKWLKFSDGETYDVKICLPSFAFKSHWVDNKKVPCQQENCPHCKSGIYAPMRFALNVITDTGIGLKAYILECSKEMFLEIDEYAKEYGINCYYRIKRIGQGRDTKYRITPQPELQKDKLDELNAIELHDLIQVYNDNGYVKYTPKKLNS